MDTSLVSVVDDDSSVRRSVTNLLGSIGFAVIALPSAEAFLASPNRRNTACLVLDLRMLGGMSGLDLLWHLSAEGSRIPVIILTGRASTAMRDQCLATGAVTFLTKPFQAEALIDAVRSAVEQGRADVADTSATPIGPGIGRGDGRLEPENQHAELPRRARTLAHASRRIALEYARRIEAERRVVAERLALEERERVIGVVSHELKNSLSAVMMGAALIAEQLPSTTPSGRVATRILSSAHRMEGIVADLLDVTRTRQGLSVAINPVPTDADEVCVRIVGELQQANPRREIRLEIGGDAKGHWDRKRLEQVVSNLVANALQYGAEDRPVTVTSGATATEWTLSVHNLGEPIPSHIVTAIFEPFQHAASATRKSGGRNLGIGLFIVQQVVLAHGGAIDVSSSAADGTRFSVRLPRLVSWV